MYPYVPRRGSTWPLVPPADATLPLDLEYADGPDFMSTSHAFFYNSERFPLDGVVAHHQREENGTPKHHPKRRPGRGRMAYDVKVASLLEQPEDVARWKLSPSTSCRRCGLGTHTLQLKIRLYESFAVPVLTYNMVMRGLTKTDLDRMYAFHFPHNAT